MGDLGVLGIDCPSGRECAHKNSIQTVMGIGIHENGQAGGRRKFGQGIWGLLYHDLESTGWPSAVYFPSAILRGVARRKYIPRLSVNSDKRIGQFVNIIICSWENRFKLIAG